ncbi:MAG: ABC transporter ATP-binding protein [Clostridiales bacterium]|nr:ABC transporter ATP-binding protein [Clostridiales bacterium]
MKNKKLSSLSKSKYILFLLKPYWKYGKGYMLTVLLMSTLLQPVSAYLTALLPQKAIDAVMSDTPRNEVISVIVMFTLFIVFVAASEKVIQMAYTQMTLVKISNRIKNDVNKKALRTDYKYYDRPDFFVKFIFAQETYPIHAQNVVMLFPDILRGASTMIAMVAIIASVGPVLLGITAFFVVLNAVVGIPVIKPSADYDVSLTDAWRPLDYVSRMLKIKENAAELRSSGAGLKLLYTINAAMANFQKTYKQYMKKVAPFYLLQGAVSPIQAACVLAYVIFFVIAGDKTQIGLYASLTIASTALAESLNDAAGGIMQMLQCIVNGEKVAEFFEAKSDIEPVKENALPAPEGKYEVEFKDASFGYENTSFSIENLNLKIKPGQRVAIVGENGSGKTTLTKLLLRLYDVSNGAVLINGKNIKEYDIHQLRQHTGVVFQDVRLLAMSLRDNLTVYHDVSDEKLLEIIDKLDLSEILKKANGDLDTMISREFTQDGIALSGGEAQRLMIARLFTGSFGLLILDEPSSALDPLAEVRLMQNILDASNTATTIMIAHRLSAIRDFDIIYHMEHGKIIESGTHDELMSARGKYYEMFVRQGENYQSQRDLS